MRWLGAATFVHADHLDVQKSHIGESKQEDGKCGKEIWAWQRKGRVQVDQEGSLLLEALIALSEREAFFCGSFCERIAPSECETF